MGVVEFYSRKQPPVCRSTFSAELTSVDDASSIGFLIIGMFAALTMGPKSAAEIAHMTESERICVGLEVAADNKGLLSGAAAAEAKVPSGLHLLHVLKALRDWLDTPATRCAMR